MKKIERRAFVCLALALLLALTGCAPRVLTSPSASGRTPFDWPQPDHFRVVMLPEAGDLARAMTDVGEFLQSYRQ